MMRILITGGQSIRVSIVEEGVIPITPGPWLGPDPQVLICDKLWRVVGMGLHLQVSICHADTHTRQG